MISSRSHHTRGVVLMLGSATCFATNVLLIRALGTIEAANVWLVACVRFVVGILIVATLYRRAWQPRNLFRHGKLVNRGIVGGASVYGFYLTVLHLGAGRATFINNTYVIFGALLAVWLIGERFRPMLAIGSVAALIGLALLTNAFSVNAHASGYDLIAVLTALASAYVVVTIRELHAMGEHTSTIFAAQCVYGLLICALPAALTPIAMSAQGVSMMVLAGVFAGAGQITMTYAFRDLPVAEGSLLQMLVPVLIAIGGIAFFSEHFAAHDMLGAALILGGTAFTALRR